MPRGTVTTAPTPLGEALRQRGLTIAWLQDQLHLSRSFADQLVWGRAGQKAMRKWAPRIAELLGMPVSELFPALKEETDAKNA